MSHKTNTRPKGAYRELSSLSAILCGASLFFYSTNFVLCLFIHLWAVSYGFVYEHVQIESLIQHIPIDFPASFALTTKASRFLCLGVYKYWIGIAIEMGKCGFNATNSINKWFISMELLETFVQHVGKGDNNNDDNGDNQRCWTWKKRSLWWSEIGFNTICIVWALGIVCALDSRLLFTRCQLYASWPNKRPTDR